MPLDSRVKPLGNNSELVVDIPTKEEQVVHVTPAKTEEEDKKEEIIAEAQAKEEQAAREDKVVCEQSSENNVLLEEIADLKKRLKKISSVIPAETAPAVVQEPNQQMAMMLQMMQMQMQMMQSMQEQSANNYNPTAMGFNPFSNMMMGQGFFPAQQTPASQVLSTNYPVHSSPINITNNNYYYGHNTTPVNSNGTPIPQGYFSSDMNFGGLDQVSFTNSPAQTQSNKRIPAYFAF